MKKKKLLPLFAMLTAGSILFLSGCSVDVTNINEEEVPLSVEMEEQNLSEGSISMHSIWYDTAGDKLSSADIAFYDDTEEVFSGTTDENGNLDVCVLPCNTELYCTISDSAGTVNAECEILIKLSEDYSNLTIYPTEAPEEDEIAECVIEIPLDKTDIRASAFITADGAISFSSLTPYVEEEAAAQEESEDAEAEEAETKDAEAEDAEAEAEEVIAEEPAQEEEDTAEESNENEDAENAEE